MVQLVQGNLRKPFSNRASSSLRDSSSLICLLRKSRICIENAVEKLTEGPPKADFEGPTLDFVQHAELFQPQTMATLSRLGPSPWQQGMSAAAWWCVIASNKYFHV